MVAKVVPLEEIIEKSYSMRRVSGIKVQKSPSIFNRINTRCGCIEDTQILHFYVNRYDFCIKHPVLLKQFDLKQNNLGDYYYLGIRGYFQKQIVSIYSPWRGNNCAG